MSDFWLNVVGLTIAGGLVALALARFVKALLTGDFNYGAGIHFRKDEQPQRYRFHMVMQFLGSILIIWIYGMLLYSKFITDNDWMSR